MSRSRSRWRSRSPSARPWTPPPPRPKGAGRRAPPSPLGLRRRWPPRPGPAGEGRRRGRADAARTWRNRLLAPSATRAAKKPNLMRSVTPKVVSTSRVQAPTRLGRRQAQTTATPASPGDGLGRQLLTGGRGEEVGQARPGARTLVGDGEQQAAGRRHPGCGQRPASDHVRARHDGPEHQHDTDVEQST